MTLRSRRARRDPEPRSGWAVVQPGGPYTTRSGKRGVWHDRFLKDVNWGDRDTYWTEDVGDAWLFASASAARAVSWKYDHANTTEVRFVRARYHVGRGPHAARDPRRRRLRARKRP